ncbi:MAG: tripartite tricarboxylate transporter substrate binding protein [Pigmentiphaga sp.]|uniref:Bug family tripartite tricarboxylate transporter substrate binding protein n=1 Tax=Pigmentiphaga sp. TaxID=1977564 RepID=UPI0029AAD81F|nr:tripartite tricarboxylate transporter substrate binding protein [Pigmentiphaga sp.]MDX3906096.1 tripartite tricarboxylate transporter substrate binding protein [Pigmentiphaga sp.]
MIDIVRRHTALFAAGLLSCCAAARADYPDRPIRIVLPYAPGAAGDIVIRQVQPLLEKRLGQPLIVDYRTGAGGNIGAQEVVRAKPDGYTLLLGATNNFVINQFLYKTLGFDPLQDFAMVGKVADVPAFIYINAAVPAKDYAEFAEYARKHPGKLNYGSPGTGTTPHLSAFMLSEAMQARMTHIPYRGSSPGVQALLANEIQLYIGGYGIASAYMPQQRVRALAVASPSRYPGLDQVPTAAEAGMPDVVLSNWWALAAPKGTDPAVVATLSKALSDVLATPQVREAFAQGGFVPGKQTPAAFQAALREEARRWQEIVQKSGVALDN